VISLFDEAIVLEVLLLLMKNEQEEVLQKGLPNDVHKYKANFQAEGSLLPFKLLSTGIPVILRHSLPRPCNCEDNSVRIAAPGNL